jgi:hypothetical protein
MMDLNSVDFPEPFGPTSAVIVPGSTVQLALYSAKRALL